MGKGQANGPYKNHGRKTGLKKEKQQQQQQQRAGRLQASPVPKNVGGLTSWSIQLDSPGTALTVT